MDFRQLTTFRTLALTLNFHQAAEQLDYVQSTVTAQIQALEEDLGTRLFDRLGRYIKLTEAGERLLPYTEQLLTIAEEARTAVSGQKGYTGTLTIGATETLCTYRLPAVLHQFRLTYPQVRLLLTPSPFSSLRRLVSDGQVDLAFLMEEPITATALHAESLLAESILLVASADHPLARYSAILPSDLENETLLMTEAGCSYRLQFQHQLNKAGIQPTTIMEFESIEAIKQCTLIGMGIAILPAITVTTEIQQGKLVVLPWSGEPIGLIMQMIWHKQKWLSPVLQAFLQVARNNLVQPTRS
ncbi:LysR family transcriptional regulator [Ktedonospora formicarum]|uniref:Putative HTH-type transcriptional regulator YwqM n=1 Tax=Ktedonospora formicarum TaxID=2778364 RepID=A0A8J3ID15_9CHLR|nr:LysR family transcriptional regulator [Ktedonospora formicarum]GHO50497.1 putative HTH-type transcriptional regulator YwqM [Ktedonospora formicarum]